MSSSLDHAADEAGGEAIYCSDGLDPLPVVVVPPPIVSSSSLLQVGNNNNNNEAILDSGSIRHPSEAFEVFHGKLYYPSPAAATGVSSSSSSRIANSNNNETPLQRLARLQQETNEWIRDFDASHYGSDESIIAAATTAAGPDDKAADPAAGKTTPSSDSVNEAYQLAVTLRNRLSQASLQVPQKQQKLTQVIHTNLEQISSAAAAAAAAEKTTSTQVVTDESASSSSYALEQRLIRLEQLLGSSSIGSEPLLHRLEQLEHGFRRLDGKALEDAATKAKVIRADLEAASKAKTKLAMSSRKEDTKTIVSLHDQMIELQGFSAHLPALVHRLQQLATLHGQAAQFATRLAETERDVTRIGTMCTKLEETMDKVETGMTENLINMENNMKVLDERLQKLS